MRWIDSGLQPIVGFSPLATQDQAQSNGFIYKTYTDNRSFLCNMPLKRAARLSENHKYVTLFTIGGPPNHAIMDINGDRRNRLRLVQEA